MITRPTVLVLGAGASADYGFPLGYRVVTQICHGLTSPNEDLHKRLLGCAFSANDIESFRIALELSAQLSIDTFLENRPDFLKIGKAAIACCLIPCESQAIFHRRGSNY